jgi:hypothetical protein
VFAFAADVQPIASSLYLLVGIGVSTLILVSAYRTGYGRGETRTSENAVEAAKLSKSLAQ